MCGRYIYEDKNKKVFKRFKIIEDQWSKGHTTEPIYNIAPGFIVPVITKDSYNRIKFMKWGLIPSWAKDPNIGYKLINARGDSITEKASFRDSFKKRRCLVPATGFYEWKHIDASKLKIPYLFQLKEHELFSMAGLYDIWKDAEGTEVMTFTIITTEPNSLMESVHNRMPVLLSEKEEEIWLDKSVPLEVLTSFLDPFPSDKMDSYTVSQEVNNPKNQGSELVKKFEY